MNQRQRKHKKREKRKHLKIKRKIAKYIRENDKRRDGNGLRFAENHPDNDGIVPVRDLHGKIIGVLKRDDDGIRLELDDDE